MGSDRLVMRLPHGWRLYAQVPEGLPLFVRGASRLRPMEMLHNGAVWDLYEAIRYRERFESYRKDSGPREEWTALFNARLQLEEVLRMRCRIAREAFHDRARDAANDRMKAEVC